MIHIKQPWAIKEINLTDALKSIVEKTNALSDGTVIASNKQFKVDDTVAVINIDGIIVKDAGVLEGRGFTGTKSISVQLSDAVNNPNINSILLYIDSPGGTVNGVPELADTIKEVSKIKPVIAFTDGQMDSAAYWLGSSANAIYATKSASIGSIGVYRTVTDLSKALASDGIEVKVIKSGKFKGTGIEGTPLTPEQISQIQSEVDYIYNKFASQVKSNRGNIAEDVMQGQDFYAEQALEHKLIDGIVDYSIAIRDAKIMAKINVKTK